MVIINSQHLRFAIEVAKFGSISKAADHLLFSQPNLSSALKTLEAELGFPIFYRTNKGIAPTPKGEQFLSSARKIIAEYDAISSINDEKKHYRFHLSAGYHSAVEEAFAIFCSEYSLDGKLDFSLINTNFLQIIENVYQNKSDLGIVIVPFSVQESFLSTCFKKNLHAVDICTLSYYLYMNENHPLLQESPLDFEKLSSYPYVDYPLKVTTIYAKPIFPAIIDQSNCILVDDRNTRYRIVSNSNAFTIGCGLHPKIRNHHRLATIRIPDMQFYMYAIQRSDQDSTPEMKRYLQILKHEVSIMDT